jgi:hypothetical protein
MEIHNLSISFTPREVQQWLKTKETQSTVQVINFKSEEGGFTVHLKYKKIALPIRLKLLEANYSLIRLEILSLPSILSALPLNLWQSQGLKLKGRELWIDLLTASRGRINKIALDEISFHPDRITVKVRDLEVVEPFALRYSS